MFIELIVATRGRHRELLNLNYIKRIAPAKNSKGGEVVDIDGRLYDISYPKLIKLIKNENTKPDTITNQERS